MRLILHSTYKRGVGVLARKDKLMKRGINPTDGPVWFLNYKNNNDNDIVKDMRIMLSLYLVRYLTFRTTCAYCKYYYVEATSRDSGCRIALLGNASK